MTSILAQVEPQKYAVSFQKPVKIKEIYVMPGQRVKKGDQLIKVERPDLLLDVESKRNQIANHQLRLQSKEADRKNKIHLANSIFEFRKEKIDVDLEKTALLMSNQEGLTKNLKMLEILKSEESTDQSFLKLKHEILLKEHKSLKDQLNLELIDIKQMYEIDTAMIHAEINYLKKEIALLKSEEKDLIQLALNDGTIGNVYAQNEELISPFTTLISVYDNNPTTIRALINEQVHMTLKPGDLVKVVSTNRKYEISGEVLEVGSRIIEYPTRLKAFQEVMVYGREIFIRIPQESTFLNGEKVFVRLN